MRRSSSQTDTRDAALTLEGGVHEPSSFDRAYARLVDAWTRHDQLRGRPDHVRQLAEASRALHEARSAMASHRGI